MEENNGKRLDIKAGFSSRIGFILAAAGSAVGLGNIWRFPYLAAEYGGGMFLLIYLILTVTFGFALMLTEVAIGRKTGKTVIGAYAELSSKFKALGWVASLVPTLILPYYCVIGGWVLKYFWTYLIGGSQVAASPVVTESGEAVSYFTNFISSSPVEPTVFFLIYIVLTAVVVMLGVEKGIEKFSKFLMPVLILIILGVAIYSLTLPNAIDGLLFYVVPNFENFDFLKTLVAAMGQLFYSLSIAMGIMVTYGSYMRKEDSLETSVRQIEIFDTGIAFLAGMMIIPTLFAFPEYDPVTGEMILSQGPGMMFEALPKVFAQMPGGQFIGILFFLLVALAALTSSISLMETVVSIVMEKAKLKRIPATFCVLGGSIAIGMLSVLGYNVLSDVKLFGKNFLDFFDFSCNNIIMPLVALFTCILVGYVVKTKTIESEVEVNAKFRSKLLYRIMIKYVAPVFMIAIFLSSIFGYV